MGPFNAMDRDSDGFVTGTEHFAWLSWQDNYTTSSYVDWSDEQMAEILYASGDENRDGKIDTAEWLKNYIYFAAGGMWPSM